MDLELEPGDYTMVFKIKYIVKKIFIFCLLYFIWYKIIIIFLTNLVGKSYK